MPGQLSQFKILDVKSPAARMQPRIVPLGGNGFRIMLGEFGAGPDLDGTCLTVYTDAPTMKEIKVLFRVVHTASGSSANTAKEQGRR